MDYPELFSANVEKIIHSGENPFDFKELIKTYNKQESIQINTKHGPKIIIAGSGMCEGGRVNYHLVRYLEGKENLALFVGYQVESTLGRKISTGNRDVMILGTPVNINAKVGYVSGFSAHADQKELLEWIDAVEDVYCVYLIHGDVPQLEMLKSKIKKDLQEKVHIVKIGEQIHL